MIDRAAAAHALYASHRALIEKHTVEHRWVCAGSIRADNTLELDEAPGQPFYHYSLLDCLTLPDPMCSVSVTDSHGDTLTVDVPRPDALTPPQPGDRVAVLVFKTRADDALDDGPYKEAWVLGRLTNLVVAP